MDFRQRAKILFEEWRADPRPGTIVDLMVLAMEEAASLVECPDCGYQVGDLEHNYATGCPGLVPRNDR